MRNNKNTYVFTCPPCGENVALATKRECLAHNAAFSVPLVGKMPWKGKRGFLNKETSFTTPLPACGVLPPQGGQITARGFTLIELLVVVLIIGILAAVAVPQYQKTIERSKATEALSMLSSVAKAYQTYYLANGQYAEKFDELDIDIPFTGNTKFYNLAKDTKSNKDWSFQIEKNSNSVVLFAARIDGKYKGAGFSISFDNPSHSASKQVKCFERKSEAYILFDTNLPEGAYCERIMQAKKFDESIYSRSYRLP